MHFGMKNTLKKQPHYQTTTPPNKHVRVPISIKQNFFFQILATSHINLLSIINY